MAAEIFDRITALLDEAGVAYHTAHHAPVRTSEEAADARGEPLEIGGKAIVMKVDGEFLLFVLSAARQIDSKALKEHFDARDVRFATPEELMALTGLVPGSVPPFGEPILPLYLYVDFSTLENDRIAFNAGSLTDSIIMDVDDYVRLVDPVVLVFSKEQ